GSFGQVKQSADAWVSLIIVIAECALVIAPKAGDTPISNQRPVVAEPLIYFEFYGLVFALRVLIRIRLSVRLKFPAKQRSRCRNILGISWLRSVRVGHHPCRLIHRRKARATQ